MKKFLTAKDFIELPLSDATEQVIFDIEAMRKKGIKIDMSYWTQVDINDRVCSVCAGGAACVTFNSAHKLTGTKYPGADKVDVTAEEWGRIPYTFDDVRQCNYFNAYKNWYNFPVRIDSGLKDALYDLEDHHTRIAGELITDEEFKRLYRQMEEFADVLRRFGK